MMSRFSMPSGDSDKRLLDRVTQIELKLYRSEGKISGQFELTGELGGDEEEFCGGPMQADDFNLIRALFERFGQPSE
jgi:hypothetical protein